MMEKPLYVIGIDGGGTKSTAVLCALDGNILAEAQGGPTNFHITGIEPASHTILDLIASCCHTIGCTISQIGAVVAGLAGAGRSTDQQQMLDGLMSVAQKRSLPLNSVVVESDARIAVEGAFSGKPGIIVIAGTGSIVFAKDERGKTFRSGGWGRLIGDEGSGYAIGQSAFRAVARAIDNRTKRTRLATLFEEKHGLGTQQAIINALYKEQFDIASTAPLVMEAASKGDPAAKKILSEACTDLTGVIRAVLCGMNKGLRRPPRRPLAFVGRLLEKENMYSRMLRTSIRRERLPVTVHSAESSPVVGAALMAIEITKS